MGFQEKLGRIKDTHNRCVRLQRDSIDWLIEQAEQKQEFEEKYDQQLEVSQETYDHYKEQIKKLREVAEYYAYKIGYSEDGGDIARNALEELK